MSENTNTDRYKFECIKLKQGLNGKRSIIYILNNYFPELKGEKRRLIRIDIVNALNGNSLAKANKHDLMRIFKEVYKIKTGKAFRI